MIPTPNDKPPHTELVELNLKDGNAVFMLDDGDDWTEFKATFSSCIYYEDTSFSHAFGFQKEGDWELDLEGFTLTATDYEGKVLAFDKTKAADAIYERFYDNPEYYKEH